MCNVFEVAKKICEAGNWEVTNLQLQKMLYIAQVLYIGQSDTNHHYFEQILKLGIMVRLHLWYIINLRYLATNQFKLGRSLQRRMTVLMKKIPLLMLLQNC